MKKQAAPSSEIQAKKPAEYRSSEEIKSVLFPSDEGPLDMKDEERQRLLAFRRKFQSEIEKNFS